MFKNPKGHKKRFGGVNVGKRYLRLLLKELAQRADINRKTFYTHYTSIYDVSGEIENEMIQNLKRLIQESCIASRDFAPMVL